MEQKRLIIWVVLSIVILVSWSYLSPRFYPTEQTNQPAPRTVSENSSAPTPAQVAPTPQQPTTTPAAEIPAQADNPQRKITIVTPLYEAKFDSKGAVAVSWIVKKNKDTDRPINGFDQKPLELISSEGLRRNQAPLRVLSGDASLDSVLTDRNYQVSVDGAVADGPETRVVLEPGQTKRIEFVLRDAATALDVNKSFVFTGDRYDIDLEVNARRNNENIPRLNLAIGPNVGDQTVAQYTFYSVAPEAVVNINGSPERHHSTTIHEDEKSADFLGLKGQVDWAGVGDTYFAMVAVPANQADGVEYRTTKYEQEVNDEKEDRYLISGYLPLSGAGGLTNIYVGPKDHYILKQANDALTADVKRPVDLEGLIDYGWFSQISRPLAEPILWSIRYLRDLTNSYGLAIIIFTIIIYSLFFPLKWRSSKAMKKAQKMAPRMKELQEKIKGLKPNDPKLKDLQMEQLRLMKEGNPLGGCLPLLIQMPFLFALYRAITISIDFRQAQFLWLPDLSAADPYHMLPILMAGSMLVLQLVTPAPSADPLQRKMMAFMMPAMMLWFFWSAPAGLLVYWLVGNIVGFSQQFLINRLTKSPEDDQTQPPAKSETKKPKKLPPTPRVSQA